jgi:hypothetical protein
MYFYLLTFLLSFSSAASDLKFDSVEAVSCSPKLFDDDIKTGDIVAAYFLKDVSSEKWYASLGYAKFRLLGIGSMAILWSEPFIANSIVERVEDQNCKGCSLISFDAVVSGSPINFTLSEYYDYGWNAVGGGYSASFEVSGKRAKVTCGIANLNYDLNWSDETYTTILKELIHLSGQTTED